MQEGFLRRFIGEELYLQNPPLKTDKFINFCRKRGINTNEDELEFFEKEGLFYPLIRIDRPIREEERIEFEKDGGTFWRPAHLGLEEGEEEIRRYKKKYYSQYGFDKYFIGYLLDWLEEGNLFDPSTKPFKEWSSFKDKELNYDSDKIVSFYSSFQIYWLDILKRDYTIQINFAGDKIRISSDSYCRGVFNPGSFLIDDISEFNSKYEEMTKNEIFGNYFDFKNKRDCLRVQYKNFNSILEFLLSIQSVYTPYGRSSSKTIRLKDDNWHEKREIFDPKAELELSGFTIQEIGNFYHIFSKKVRDILGVRRDDWIQLWKSIAWNEKDELEGDIRLGIEYLQWALMLKRFMEDYRGIKVLDIDEMSGISRNDILNFNPDEMDQYGRLLRASRNKKYIDPEKNRNYYYDRYKRVFYLANDFELNYQPRIMVFVEGKSEEMVFPKIFEWYYNKPENIGIEIVNFKGVDKLLSTSKNTEKLRNLIYEIQADIRDDLIIDDHKRRLRKLIKDLKDTDIVISNWTSFISYNLEKWQIIPFFTSDNEGNVKHFLDAEKPIKFEGKYYNVPDEWRFLWGTNNENKPYNGKDLEFANFTDDEIALAIGQTVNENIDVNKVKEIRNRNQGINKIHPKISEQGNKVKIVDTLFENLFKKYDENNDDSIFKRPIFKMIDKILDLSHSNHPPVNTIIELKNKEYILNLLEGKNFDNY